MTLQGEPWWALAAVLPGRSSWSAQVPAIVNRTFEQWVHEIAVLNTAPMFTDGEPPGWVTLSGDGRLTAHQGASILEQTSQGGGDQA